MQVITALFYIHIRYHIVNLKRFYMMGTRQGVPASLQYNNIWPY